MFNKTAILKTAILIPGAFNPVTNAHLEMGKIVQELYPEADIWYIPCNDRYMSRKPKGYGFLTEDERLHLLNKAVLSREDTDSFCVSPIEINGKVDGYTYNTIEYFKHQKGYEKVYLCVGVDKLQGFSNWYQAEKLITENTILVCDRTGSSLENYPYPFIKQYSLNFISVAMNPRFHNISATKVRKAFEDGDFDFIKQNVPEPVFDFLSEKRTEVLSL